MPQTTSGVQSPTVSTARILPIWKISWIFFIFYFFGLFCHLELRYLYFPSAQKITPCLVDRPVCLSLPVSLTLWLSASSWTLLSGSFTTSLPSIVETFISTTYLPITALFRTFLETAQCFSSVFKFKLFFIRKAVRFWDLLSSANLSLLRKGCVWSLFGNLYFYDLYKIQTVTPLARLIVLQPGFTYYLQCI